MTNQADMDHRLERGLRSLASWGEDLPRPRPWERAVAESSMPSARSESLGNSGPWYTRRVHPGVLVGVFAVVFVVVVVGGVLLPSLARSRQSSISFSNSEREERSALSAYSIAQPPPGDSAVGFDPTQTPATEELIDLLSRRVDPEAQPNTSAASPDRHVVRKATVELKTPDVRAAFLKASLIPNAAAGEFVQDSAVTGDVHVSANLTLRVAAARLPEVLNQLRELGKVTGEQVRGEDVTAQVVDVEARLRNERRIEQELLALLDQRNDAPLKDILELRAKLGEVRDGIERLDAQRANLSRLVSLATVLVLIRADAAPEPERAAPALLSKLSKSFGAAWRSGVEFLIGSTAWIVQVAIGGLIWWTIAVVAVVVVRGQRRRAAVLRGGV